MSDISATKVKQLRDQTGAGMMDCKSALQEANGDFDEAITILRKKGIATAARKAGRTASEGVVTSYIHPGSKIGVLVEVNCETDFVARTAEFQAFAHDIAVQIAAMNPRYLMREDVPEDILNKEREILFGQLEDTKKPDNIKKQIVEGRLDKWYAEFVLMDQAFVKDESTKVNQLIQEHIAKFGENIIVRRFTRYKLGESSQ
ncbi:MAG TPA: translation elongation factor Ts [Acidobacteriota bacterium]|nr:translation elongation factor Ts [Acidobacteriota bacterium]